MRVRRGWRVWVLLLVCMPAGVRLWAQEGASGPVGPDGQAGSVAERNANGVYTIQQYARLVVLDAVVTDRRGMW